MNSKNGIEEKTRFKCKRIYFGTKQSIAINDNGTVYFSTQILFVEWNGQFRTASIRHCWTAWDDVDDWNAIFVDIIIERVAVIFFIEPATSSDGKKKSYLRKSDTHQNPFHKNTSNTSTHTQILMTWIFCAMFFLLVVIQRKLFSHIFLFSWPTNNRNMLWAVECSYCIAIWIC